MQTQQDEFILELESLRQEDWKEQKQDWIKISETEKEYNTLDKWKQDMLSIADNWIIIDDWHDKRDIHAIMENIWITEAWIIEKLKEWIEKATKVDKQWNIMEDWDVKARMLDMLAKMKGMYKKNNEQSKAVVNVLNAFQQDWKHLL